MDQGSVVGATIPTGHFHTERIYTGAQLVRSLEALGKVERIDYILQCVRIRISILGTDLMLVTRRFTNYS